MIRLINIVAIALFIIMTVILIKYQLVCEVTVDGEKLGYITDKEQFEQSVNEIINKEENNKLYTVIEKMPEYTLTFVDRTEEVNEEKVLAKIEENSETTYKLYAVTVDGKEKATIANLDEAESLVKELNKKYKDDLDVKVAIVDVITTDNEKDVTTIKTAKTDITKELDKQVEKKEAEEAKAKAAAKAKAQAKAKAKKTTSTKKSTTKKTTTTTKVASLNGVKLTVKPVSGVITSRFGNRESIRSHSHSGLDIGAPKGTPIKAAAGGTVTFAGYSGGYGYVVKISHGGGIKTYYAHCSKLYVKKGDTVSAGDKIAAVGSTGNSTGNHLHFEVVKNGTSLNPQHYLYK